MEKGKTAADVKQQIMTTLEKALKAGLEVREAKFVAVMEMETGYTQTFVKNALDTMIRAEKIFIDSKGKIHLSIVESGRISEFSSNEGEV